MKNYFASKIKYLMAVVAIIVKKKRKEKKAQREGVSRAGGLKPRPICAVKERNHENTIR